MSRERRGEDVVTILPEAIFGLNGNYENLRERDSSNATF